jgi:hypothetical protein
MVGYPFSGHPHWCYAFLFLEPKFKFKQKRRACSKQPYTTITRRKITMKNFIKTLRILNTGILLGMAFTIWVLGEDEKEEKEIKPYEPSDEFMNIYNHYNNKEKANA